MSLNYLNLDGRVRTFMLEEINLDVQAGKLYISPRLTSIGERDWPDMLQQAASRGSDATLADEIRKNGRLKDFEQKRKPRSDEFTTAKVPVTAPETMAEGEFNRFYARGLCRLAAVDGISHLVIYRAKEVEHPRADSEHKINMTIDPAALLKDLRTNIGMDTALGLPAGPNSGLSVRLP